MGGRARAHHRRPRDLQRGDRPRAARGGRRARRRVHDVPRLPQPHALEEGARRLHLARSSTSTARTQSPSSSTRSRISASTTARRPASRSRRTTSSSRRRRRRSSPSTRSASQKVEQAYEHGLITESERHESIVNIWTEATETVAEAMVDEPERAEPDLHDGQLGCTRLVRAASPARRHARPDGESEGRDHRAPDQGQLHGRPVGARVLHLDPRCPQGPRRHGAPHGRLGLPDAASRRRLAGRDHPRARTASRRSSSSCRSSCRTA